MTVIIFQKIYAFDSLIILFQILNVQIIKKQIAKSDKSDKSPSASHTMNGLHTVNSGASISQQKHAYHGNLDTCPNSYTSTEGYSPSIGKHGEICREKDKYDRLLMEMEKNKSSPGRSSRRRRRGSLESELIEELPAHCSTIVTKEPLPRRGKVSQRVSLFSEAGRRSRSVASEHRTGSSQSAARCLSRMEQLTQASPAPSSYEHAKPYEPLPLPPVGN